MLFFCSSLTSFSQNTYYSAQSGNWNAESTWQGGIVPGPTDNAVIQTGHTIMLQVGGTGTVIHDVNIEAGAVLDGNGKKLTLSGDWFNDGVFLAGNGLVTFSGSSDQTITNPSNETFYALTIDKPVGILILNDRVTVSNTLTMNQGDVDATGTRLRLGTGTGNPGTLNHTSGIVIGQFRRWCVYTGFDYLFPVGSIGSYRPVIITFNDLTPDPLRIEFIPGDPGGSGLPLNENGIDIIEQFTEGMWELNPGNDLSTGDYDIQLTATDFTSYPIMEGTRIITRDMGNDWKLDGFHLPTVEPDLYRSNLTNGISSSRTQFGIGHIYCNPIIISRTITDVSCFGGNDGAIDVTVSGGDIPYRYQWDHGPTTEDVSSLFAGTYSLNVTDDHGCEVDSIFTVSEPTSLSAMIDSTSASCPGASDGKISIVSPTGGSGSYEYTINGGASWEALGDYTGLASGTYDLRLRDAAMPTCFAVLDPAFVLLDTDMSPPVAVCKDISVQLDASGNATITPFDIDNGSNDESGIAFMSVSPDAFSCGDMGLNPVTLTVTDNNGNESSCMATVTVVDGLPPSLTCPGDRTEPVDGSMNFSIPVYTSRLYRPGRREQG